MPTNKIRYIVLILFLSTFQVMAQQKDCRNLLRSALKNMKQVPASQKVHMQYTIKYVLASTGNTNEVHLSFYGSSKDYKIITEDAEIYQNESICLTISHNRKLAIITKPSSGDFREKQFLNISMIQDSVLSKSNITQCECTEEGYQSVTLGLGNIIANYLGFQSVTYQINPESKSISQIMGIGSKGGMISSLELIINEYNKDYRGDIFTTQRVQHMLADAGSLNKFYTGYKIIDRR